jgi:hypothetical protein
MENAVPIAISIIFKAKFFILGILLIQLGKPPAMPGDSVRFDRSGGH